MANGITTAFWSVTINNYTEADLALVQNGYADYCREIVHTLEEGESGTPHIQAWVKLQRQQRMSFVKKLFPRGHFRPLTSDEYVHNTKVYAQKLDGTAVSAAVHRFNDPIHTLETVCKRVGNRVEETRQLYEEKGNDMPWERIKESVERDMVAHDDFRFAKVFVSSTYKQMWKQFGVEMCIYFTTHTHTHTQVENNFAEVDIPTIEDGESEACGESEDESGRLSSDGCEDDDSVTESEGSQTETDSESGDSGCSEASDE